MIAAIFLYKNFYRSQNTFPVHLYIFKNIFDSPPQKSNGIKMANLGWADHISYLTVKVRSFRVVEECTKVFLKK